MAASFEAGWRVRLEAAKGARLEVSGARRAEGAERAARSPLSPLLCGKSAPAPALSGTDVGVLMAAFFSASWTGRARAGAESGSQGAKCGCERRATRLLEWRATAHGRGVF